MTELTPEAQAVLDAASEPYGPYWPLRVNEAAQRFHASIAPSPSDVHLIEITMSSGSPTWIEEHPDHRILHARPTGRRRIMHANGTWSTPE